MHSNHSYCLAKWMEESTNQSVVKGKGRTSTVNSRLSKMVTGKTITDNITP